MMQAEQRQEEHHEEGEAEEMEVRFLFSKCWWQVFGIFAAPS
jgi:hypothetical protein